MIPPGLSTNDDEAWIAIACLAHTHKTCHMVVLPLAEAVALVFEHHYSSKYYGWIHLNRILTDFNTQLVCMGGSYDKMCVQDRQNPGTLFT